jgi:hypothetical protein
VSQILGSATGGRYAYDGDARLRAVSTIGQDLTLNLPHLMLPEHVFGRPALRAHAVLLSMTSSRTSTTVSPPAPPEADSERLVDAGQVPIEVRLRHTVTMRISRPRPEADVCRRSGIPRDRSTESLDHLSDPFGR